MWLEAAGLAALLLDRSHHILDLSPSVTELCGLSREAVGLPVKDYEQNPALVDLTEDILSVLSGGPFVEREIPDPLERCFVRRTYLKRFGESPDAFIVVTLRDVSSERAAIARLEREITTYRSLAQRLPDIVSRMDRERRHLFVSSNVTDIVDLPLEAYIGKTNWDVGLPRELCEYWDRTFDHVERTGEPARSEFSLVDKDGVERWYDDRIIAEYDETGRFAGFFSIAREITELVQTRHALEGALDERQTLIVDVHHRVKNNLFLVIGLLSLEKQRLLSLVDTPQEVVSAIDRVISRVHVISSIYTHLYENSEDARTLSSALYLGELVRLVQASEAGRPVVVETDIDDVPLPARRALPLGLILNEALSNVYKHAFPDGVSGRVFVGLRRAQVGQLVFTVADDGVGKAAVASDQAVGTNLMNSLIDQIGGSAVDDPSSPFDRGTVVQFWFEAEEERPR